MPKGGKQPGAGRPQVRYRLPEREARMLRWLAKRADRTPQEYLEWVIRTMHESAGVFSDESMNDGQEG